MITNTKVMNPVALSSSSQYRALRLEASWKIVFWLFFFAFYCFKKFYWSIVALQCVRFCSTATWISYTYIYIPVFWISFPFRSPQSNEQDSLFYTVGSHCMCMLSPFSCVQLFATLWTTACQAPLSMGFSRQEYWNGLLCPPPGDLPDRRIEPISLMSTCNSR